MSKSNIATNKNNQGLFNSWTPPFNVDSFIRVINSHSYGEDVFFNFIDYAFDYLNSIGNKESLEYVKKFVKDNENEMELYNTLFHIMVSSLEEKYCDFLGQAYMQLERGNKKNGEFFTPDAISTLMALLNGCPQKKDLKELPFKILEPSSGAGGTLIAMINNLLLNSDLNISKDIFIEAWDINRRCAKMTFIQMSLLGVPAKIVHGNTLTLEVFGTYYTPVYYFNMIDNSLKKEVKEAFKELIVA